MFNGRMKRGQYFLYNFLLSLFAIFFGLSVFYLLAPFWDNGVFDIEEMAALPFLLIFYAIYMVVYFSLAIRRGHDLGMKGALTVILLFVPLINYIILFMLFFFRGQDMDNEFDSKPL